MPTDEIKTIETFFKAHFRKLVAFTTIIVNDTVVAKDLVMELFLKLWERHGSNYESIKNIERYLYRSMYKNSCKYLKQKNRLEKFFLLPHGIRVKIFSSLF